MLKETSFTILKQEKIEFQEEAIHFEIYSLSNKPKHIEIRIMDVGENKNKK